MENTNEHFASGSTHGDIASLAGAAGEQLAGAAEQVRDAAQVQVDKLADAIRKRPLQSAGIAAGIGFICALVARR